MSHAYTITSDDYNQPSAERIELLKKIQVKLKHEPVPVAFWAICQLADLECLKELCVGPDKYLKMTIPGARAVTLNCKCSPHIVLTCLLLVRF